MTIASKGVDVPVLGQIGVACAQICPQNSGVMTVARANALRESFPNVEFRLHANVRVLTERMIMDVADFDAEHPYWKALREVHLALGAKLYTAHAGMRASDTMEGMLDKVQHMADFFGCPVAVEGHYPARRNPFLMSSWKEWEQAYLSGVPLVVDVSHAAIVAHVSRRRQDGLLEEMLASKQCLEVHLSGNNGLADQHRTMSGQEWWWPLLDSSNESSDFFYEGGADPALRQAYL